MANKHSSKNPTVNQANNSEKSIDIIIKKGNEAVSKYFKDIKSGNAPAITEKEYENIYELFRTGKIILLKCQGDEEQQTIKTFVDIAIKREIKNPPFGKTINCLKGKKHIENELDKCIARDIRFPFLFLNYLDTNLFDGSIADRLQEFRRKIANEYEYNSSFSYPPPIIINFIIGGTPDVFKEVFNDKFVEVSLLPSSPQSRSQAKLTKPFKQIYIEEEKTVIEPERDGVVEHVDEKATTPKPLFMDCRNNILFLDKKKNVTLKPKEIKLIEYMCNLKVFELAQILIEHFKIKLAANETISRDKRNIFDTYKSNINKQCKSQEIEDLIVKGGMKKTFKLSVKITKKTFKL
ncbi:hypothetical protein SCALIN_C04_0384 [Candidatus Scalindua japonica]|uniref:Uncharacterized protein n=1 Tax=Candidatus Scalindua japonica TaxID=1284222 RepID=A0A286TVI4_9BACT|nr:hypothetical protein [Candidatus Scalindua japonica]GAX59896.1 hypothetical protein SCALIN_C04_0384 [Candidatus Scalindua japonica]